MEIKIDTSKDSLEDIEEMITFLQSFIRKQGGSVSEVSDTQGGMFNIFDDDLEDTQDSMFGSTFDNDPNDVFESTDSMDEDDSDDVRITPYGDF